MTEIAFSRLIAALRIVLLGVIAAAAVIAACALGRSANDAKPLYLTKSQAAEYLGLSMADFELLVTAKSAGEYDLLGFKVIEIEGTTYYQRASLDFFVERDDSFSYTVHGVRTVKTRLGSVQVETQDGDDQLRLDPAADLLVH